MPDISQIPPLSPSTPSGAATVDVVIPVRNGEQTISAALASVFAQTRPPNRIIVVDDGSTDGTRNILGAVGDRVEIIATEPRGVSHARNVGVAAASADFIAFLDADDRWRADKLRRQLDIFAGDPRVGVVYCATALARPDGAVRRVKWPKLKGRIFDDLLGGGQAGNPSSVMLRRELAARTGCYDEALSYGEDFDFLLRLARVCEFDFAPEVLVDVVENPGSVSRRKTNPDELAASIAQVASILRKYAGGKPSFAWAQIFRRQMLRAVVSRGLGWRGLLQTRERLRAISPRTARSIWPGHASFFFFTALEVAAFGGKRGLEQITARLSPTRVDGE